VGYLKREGNLDELLKKSPAQIESFLSAHLNVILEIDNVNTSKQENQINLFNENPEVTVNTTTGVYNGVFYNRSHLIAHRLGGKTDSDNAITGTRMQNVGNRSNTGGMYYIEDEAVDYLTHNRKEYLYLHLFRNLLWKWKFKKKKDAKRK